MFSHYRYKENSCQKREAIPDKSRVSLTFLQKRTDSSNVTVAVAVAVPIGAIIIVLSVVLIVVYRRCKKEPSMQDLDPNFEGDLYYLPKMDSSMNSANSDSNATEKRFIYGGYDDFLQPSIENSQSFKDYVRRINEHAPSAYNIASLASQNNSKLSVPSKHIDLSNKISFESLENSELIVSPQHSNTGQDCDQRCDSTSNPDVNEKSSHNNDNRLKSNYTSRSGLEPQCSREEEENIDRIRSIYNIYFEKSNSTIRSSVTSSIRRDSKLNIATRKSVNMSSQDNPNDTTLIEQSHFGSTTVQEIDSSSSANEEYEDATDYLQVPAPQENKNIASSVYSEVATREKVIPESSLSLTFPPPNGLSTRITSSIYSDTVAKGHLHSAKAPVRALSEGSGQSNLTSAQQYPTYFIDHCNQSNDDNYYYNYPLPLEHPQNYENIGDLPTPTQFIYSTSSHSLTSFKGRPKPPKTLKHVPTARLNGTALNPMDHPEMFYSSPTKIPSTSLTKQFCTPLPYQLRQSVVMTNPSELSMKPRYKPAGSLSNLIKAQYLPGNSSTTTSSSLSQPPSTLSNAINFRVSGLLDDTDILQPPSVGETLPFKASTEDLRKQLGTSHNYEITPYENVHV